MVLDHWVRGQQMGQHLVRQPSVLISMPCQGITTLKMSQCILDGLFNDVVHLQVWHISLGGVC